MNTPRKQELDASEKTHRRTIKLRTNPRQSAYLTQRLDFWMPPNDAQAAHADFNGDPLTALTVRLTKKNRTLDNSRDANHQQRVYSNRKIHSNIERTRCATPNSAAIPTSIMAVEGSGMVWVIHGSYAAVDTEKVPVKSVVPP